MRRYDPGDAVSLRHTVTDDDGIPIAATVAFTLTKPDGTAVDVGVTSASTGVYDVTVAADTLSQLGPYRFEFEVTGTVADNVAGQFYIAAPETALPPLADFEKLVKKLGYRPEDAERDRAEHLLDESSELIRDVAGKTWAAANGALEDVPRRVALICVAAAYRAFVNPEGLSQRSIGDSSKSYDRSGREGGEDVYLTSAEEDDIRKAAGGSSMVVVTLVSPYAGPLVDPWVEATLQ
jgi:hypothetical protein